MIRYILRSNSTGQILRTGACRQSDLSLQASAEETAEENTGAWNDTNHYHDGTNYVLRPAFSLSTTSLTFTTAESLTVTGIPVGTVVNFPGGSEVVNDGEIEWDSIVSGSFKIEFQKFPYLEEVLSIEVTDV